MTRRWPLVVKEVRALLPLWAACVVAMSLHPLSDYGELESLAVLAYVFGAVALGAHAIGHEYSYRTLGTLLTQPVDRRRVLITKLAVTAAMLALLLAAAWPLVFVHFSPRLDIVLVLLPIAGGLFVAPWLTMIARNQLAGAVFTLSIAGMAFVAVELASGDAFGGSEAAEARRLLLVARGLLVFAAVAAVFGWRTFMRLEAVEGGGADFHLPRLRTADDARDAGPVWMLIRKELRLQQMSFVLAAFYVLVWSVLLARGYGATGIEAQKFAMVFGPVTLIYFWGLSLLIGSLASAEERQFGVLESQLLLPMAARTQWLIKAGTAIGVAVLLAVAVPATLIDIAGRLSLVLRGELPGAPTAALIVAGVTTCGLFVSSLSSSGIRAIMLAFPFLLGAAWLFGSIVQAMTRSGLDLGQRVFGARVEQWMAVLAGAIFMALLLSFAAANHRSSERGLPRMAWQIGCAAAALCAIPLLIAGLLRAI